MSVRYYESRNEPNSFYGKFIFSRNCSDTEIREMDPALRIFLILMKFIFSKKYYRLYLEQLNSDLKLLRH